MHHLSEGFVLLWHDNAVFDIDVEFSNHIEGSIVQLFDTNLDVAHALLGVADVYRFYEFRMGRQGQCVVVFFVAVAYLDGGFAVAGESGRVDVDTAALGR